MGLMYGGVGGSIGANAFATGNPYLGTNFLEVSVGGKELLSSTRVINPL